MKLERLRPFGEELALSWAVVAGDVIHVAGMVGMEVDFEAPSMGPITFPDGIEAQMRQAYRNIGWILGRVGASLTDIADQTLFFTCPASEARAANNVVRRDVFGDDPPASAMVGVSHLFDPRCVLELKATAYRGAGTGA
jgi:enamine deaminase RidA (YjgF/YER057c/UK114 family)